MLRVAIYIRVSTKLQEDRYSLSAQRNELTDYANKQEWEIVGYYKDVDSGGKLDKKGLNQLLDDVDDRKMDVVLCIDQDRLSRLDTVAWEYLKGVLRDNGVKIAEPGKITDLSNEDDEFISDIYNLIARREKKSIVRRMMRGKRQRTREGKGWGRTPAEYLYREGKYIMNDKWSWIIPYIDDLYLNKVLSDKQIADRLNEICKTPKGKLWSDSNVRQKLTNKAYHGVMEKSFSNGEVISVSDMYPALRSEETFLQIQQARKERYRHKQPNDHPHILRKIEITCGMCGRKIILKQSGSKRYAIHFYLKHGRPARKKDHVVCDLSVNVIRVEKNVARAIEDILTSEDFASRYIQLEHQEEDVKKLTQEIASTQKLIQEANEKLDRLLALYLSGTWSKEKLDEQKRLIENEKKIHEERKHGLENKKQTILSNTWNYELVYVYLFVAKDFQKKLTDQEQMAMVSKLFPRAIIFENELILQGSIQNMPLEVKVPIDPNPFSP